MTSTAGNVCHNCSVTPPSTNSFYGRRTPLVDDNEDTWQPGQYLVPHAEPTQPDIHSLLAQMQSAISEQIQTVQMSENALAGRMDQFEKDLTNTAEQVRFCQTPCSSVSPSSTDSDDTGKQRKRRISLDLSVSYHYARVFMLASSACMCLCLLQNTIRTIHNNVLEEKQLKTDET